ncbi:MAG: right-handed parallel beta-helix repeat-containing protein [Candidatus Krumholzibacteria bacterium]|jgi:hypothetical protein|nr:right-handed parallel beta-helix repeat-containing protein [Candidatus Krumholzibacteria bacterium]
MSGRRWLVGVLGAVAILTAGAGLSEARTWYLEKDGSGDFTVIQEAVDAAASGDTLRIGPGRWYEYWVIMNGQPVYTLISDKSLTFIGAGPTTTIIGHETPPFSPSTVGWAMLIGQSVQGTSRFEDLGFDMPGIGGSAIRNNGNRIEVRNCRFTRLVWGVTTFGIGGGFVRDCEFIDVNYNNGATGVVAYTPARDLLIEDCTFTNCSEAVGADWDGCQDITVQNCVMTGGRGGVSFASGASGTVRNCTITGQFLFGIALNRFGLVVLENNYVSVASTAADPAALDILNPAYGTLVARNNVFESGARVVIMGSARINLDCRNNYFLQRNGQGWFVIGSPVYNGPVVNLDLTGNYWGTTDVDYISQWILDGHDDPQIRYYIDFVPMADSPVPTEQKTWSEVKGLFRE